MKLQPSSRKHLTLALGWLALLVVTALADPITLTFSAQPGGYTVPDGTPCATTLNCGNGTPRGRDFIMRDASGNTLSTITFTLGPAASVTVDTGQSATVNLGLFSYTGALPPAVDYNFLISAFGVNTTNGFVASLSFAADGIMVCTSPRSPT